MTTGAAAAPSAPACGRCGYNTTGLTSLTCPECGGDLRAVGILTAATSSRRVTFLAAAAVFTVLWLVIGALLPGVIDPVVPVPKHYAAELRLAQPRSGAYGSVAVEATGTAWGDGRPPISVVITLFPKAGSRARDVGPMKVDPETGAYAYLNATSRRVSARSGFDGDAVAQWLGAAWLDSSDPRLRAEANRIAAAARHAGRRPVTFADLGGGTRSSGGNDPHFGSVSYSTGYNLVHWTWRPKVLLPFYAAVWATGLTAGLRYVWRVTRARAANA